LENNDSDRQHLTDEEGPIETTGPQGVFRVALVAFCGLVAALVPKLGGLIALVSAANGSLLAIIIPAVIDYRCPRPAGWDPFLLSSEKAGSATSRMRTFELYVDIIIVVLGTICGLWSSYMTISEAFNGS